jgi:transglutaminase-like putative cysteine protease
MRFGLVHRIMTDALALLGVLAIVSTAQLNTWTNVVLVVGIFAALFVPEGWQTRPSARHFGTIATVAVFVVQGARFVSGQSLLDVAIEFAALLQVIRVATRRGAAADQHIIVLALLHFVAGTVLGGGITYGLCFVGFLVVAPGALVLSHLRREVEGNYRQGARDRTGLPVDVPRILRSRRVVGRGFLLATCLLSVPILIFTAALFLVFPRVGLSLLLLNHPRQNHLIGFSDHVDLGQVGVLRTDPSVALRFTTSDMPAEPPLRLTLRLRGTAFDDYDGRAWQRTLRNKQEDADRTGDLYPLYRAPDLARDRKISFDLEPIDPPVIFLPIHSVALLVKTHEERLGEDRLALKRGPEGEMRYVGESARGLHYDVYVGPDGELFPETLAPESRARYLTLPPALPERIGDLAHQWTDALPTPELKARAIEDHLRRDYHYDLGSPSGGKPSPVDDFLFVSRRGHCEFFSTAMALMLREVGVPSRNVTGFVGGTYNRFGKYYAVREGDAHSWVEAYIDDPIAPGWRTFDPTPPAGAQPLEQTNTLFAYARDIIDSLSQTWERKVVRFDLQAQMRLFDNVSRGYDSLRRNVGIDVDKGALGSVTRAPVVAGAGIALMVVAYALWKRRRTRGRAGPTDPRAREPLGAKLESAAALYRALETALAHQGLARPASTPPLRHAEDIGRRLHPLAGEVMSLTHVYLETRFGGAELTESIRKDFERRVRDVRTFRPAEAVAPR